MKKTVLLLILLPISLICQELFIPVNLNKNYFSFSVQRGVTSSFYNYAGDNISYIPDSISPVHNPEYSYNQQAYTFNLKFSNTIKTENIGEFGLNFGIDYKLNNIDKKYRAIADSLADIVNSLNYNFLSNFNIGFDYRYVFSNFIADFELNYSMPFGSKSSVINDIGGDIFGDGYSVLSPALSLYYISDKYYAMVSSSYNFNSEEIEDDFSISAGIGLIGIKEAALTAAIEYRTSLGTMNEAIAFNPARYQLYQESLKAKLGFDLVFNDKYLLGIDYSLLLSGKNTPIISIFRFNASYMINFFKDFNL